MPGYPFPHIPALANPLTLPLSPLIPMSTFLLSPPIPQCWWAAQVARLAESLPQGRTEAASSGGSPSGEARPPQAAQAHEDSMSDTHAGLGLEED